MSYSRDYSDLAMPVTGYKAPNVSQNDYSDLASPVAEYSNDNNSVKEKVINQMVDRINNPTFSHLESILGGVGKSLSQAGTNIKGNASYLVDKALGKGASNKIGSYLPDDIQDYMNQKAGFNPTTLKAINSFLQAHIANAEKQNPLSEKAGEMVGTALPFMAMPEISGFSKVNPIVRAGLQGGIGAATSDNPREGALLGASAELGNNLINKPLSYIGGKLTMPSLINAGENLYAVAKGKLGHLGDIKAIKQYEGTLHNQVMTDAAKFDTRYGNSISDAGYQKALDDQADKVARSLKHNPNSPELLGEFQQLGDWANAPHGTLQEMIEHNKELNQAYGGTLSTGVKIRGWLPSFAIKNIKNTIEDNLTNNTFSKSAGQKMLSDIEAANRATKERVKNEMFADAKYPQDIFNKFNRLDEHTQKKLFSDSDILKMRIYENAMNKAKGTQTPPHLTGLRDAIAPIVRRLPGGSAVGISNQPISFESDNNQ